MRCGIEGCHRDTDWKRSWMDYGEERKIPMCEPCRTAFDHGLITTQNEVVDSPIDRKDGGSE